MQNTTNSAWFTRFKKKSNCRVRLVCFPFAGGAANSFRDWSDKLPAEVDLLVAELPGRGMRFAEPLIGNITTLSSKMADAFLPYQDLPYVFFGHSLGSLVCFELARTLRKRGQSQPKLLIASGKKPPQFPPDSRLHDLPDSRLIEALQDYDGTPEAILKNQELMKIVLPVMRADFSLNENYQLVQESKFDFPMQAWGGFEDDGVPEDALTLWGEHTTHQFNHYMFEGGHFYLHESPAKEQVLERINRVLTDVLKRPNSVLA